MKLTSFIIGATLSMSALANQTLDVIGFGAPRGGSTNKQWDIKAKVFQAAGYDLRVDYSGPTCPPAVIRWNNLGKDQKALAQQFIGSACMDTGFRAEELVGIDWAVNYNLCTRKNGDKTLTLANFLDPKREKKIALSFASSKVWQHYIDAMGLTASARLIPYDTSTTVHTAFLSNDIDYVVTFNDWSIRNSDKVECLLLAADEKNNDWPRAKLVREVTPPGTAFTSHILIFYTMARGFSPAEMTKLRQIHSQIQAFPEWQSTVMLKGNIVFKPDIESQAKVIQQGFVAQQRFMTTR